MKHLLAPILAVCLAVSSAATVLAGNDLEDMIQVEVLDGGITADGTYMSALRLTLPQGWKTYWRAPGDAGIPPQFSWRGSRNIDALEITWPTPEVFDSNGLRTIGYQNQLVLPFEITPKKPDGPVRIRGRVDLGLCKDVCIPGEVAFDHEFNTKSDRNPAIAAAMAQRPYSATEAGVRSATCRINPTKDGLQVEAQIAMPSAGGPEVAIIESGSDQFWATETTTQRRGGVLIATSELIGVNAGTAPVLDRSQLRFTVLGQRKAVDIRGCTG
jgi:DsbC/DsbD-like thiol-disulfide interchange protein